MQFVILNEVKDLKYSDILNIALSFEILRRGIAPQNDTHLCFGA